MRRSFLRFSALIVCILLLIAFVGCSKDSSEGSQTPATSEQESPSNDDKAEENKTEEEQTEAEVKPEEWEPATFSIWSWPGSIETWGGKDFNDVACFQEAEKITNTKIEWVMESDSTTFDLIMASGDLPDAIYYAWNPVRQGQYAKDGLIIDIMPYIKSSAPEILNLIENDSMVKKQLVGEGGSVYLVPWITANKELLAGEGFAIRKDWLDKLGLQIPKTPDELFDTLMAFREQDANGNGKADEIVTGYPSQIHKSAFAFGTTDGFHFAEDGKTIVYGPMTENYKEWLKWMNKLYKNNILDPDYFSWDSDIYMKKCMEDRVGLYVDNPAVLNTIVKDGKANGLNIEWVPMEYMYYKGKSVNFSSAYKRYVQPYGCVFSKDVENPERLMKWFNFWFTEEGNDLLNWGVEGVSYTVVNGKKQYTDAVLKDPELEPSASLSRFAYPTFVGVQSIEAVKALSDAFTVLCRETWAKTDITYAPEPFIAFNEEEQNINSQYSTDLATIKDAWRDKFITGEKDIEADWDEYIEELKKYHVEDLIRINQAATDRYLAK